MPCRFAEVRPAIERLWAAARAVARAPRMQAHGAVPQTPAISILVSSAGRLDLLRHQIVCFSNDPDFCGSEGPKAELIFAIDDADMADVARIGSELYDLYGVPFRTLHLQAKLGRWAALDAAADGARGATLLLLRPDILPKRPRWLTRMHEQYRSLGNCGALGCRLVFEDGSIDHAGLAFRPSADMAGRWEPEPAVAGLKANFDLLGAPVPVPAVSAACLMIERGLFAELGGLSRDYVWDGFADLDLCLAAAAVRRRSYYAPQVELYALERETLPMLGSVDALAAYNSWKFNKKWAPVLARLGAAA